MSTHEGSDQYVNLERDLQQALMRGRGKVVKSQRFSTYHYRTYTMPKYVAFAEYAFSGNVTTKKSPSIATGIGSSVEEASVKSLAEAYERYASGKVRIDFALPKKRLPYPIYDACELSPLHSNFLSREKTASSSKNEEALWIMGERMSDKAVVVAPVDQVFYPTTFAGLSYPCNSSGVAAHTSKSAAIESGFLELIERDAVAVTWYSQRSAPLIPKFFWDSDLARRVIMFSKSTRREVVFCNFINGVRYRFGAILN